MLISSLGVSPLAVQQLENSQSSPFYKLYEPVTHPPPVKGRPEEGGQLEALKLPLSFEPHVLFIVSGRSPYRLVPFSIGAGLEKVPDPLGPVAINLNDRIHYHMHRAGRRWQRQ